MILAYCNHLFPIHIKDLTIAVMKERKEYNPIWRELNTIVLVDKKEQAAELNGNDSDEDETTLSALAASLRDAANDDWASFEVNW